MRSEELAKLTRVVHKHKVKVVYGEPIYPNGETPEELMAKVREAVLALKNKEN